MPLSPAIFSMHLALRAECIWVTCFKFILIIVFIILFDAIFLFITPLIFGPDAFPANELLNINYNGVQFALKLSKELYLVLFAIIMLIFNIIIDRRNQYVYYEEWICIFRIFQDGFGEDFYISGLIVQIQLPLFWS